VTQRRVIILLFDSFGIGAADDAKDFGDEGANTLGHIAEACFNDKASRADVRQGPLYIPNLCHRGLAKAAVASAGHPLIGLNDNTPVDALYGFAQEISHGKDTPSGHWELCGVPVLFQWGYFPQYPSFPETLLNDFIKLANIPGILGNCHASGTDIMAQLGEEHMKTGKPIVYTSADSVFQIAAHEESFGLMRLYELCHIARKLVDPYNIGRVIARPFSGTPGHFARTDNRRDYSIPPPAPTLLEHIVSAKQEVIAIGKIADIFAHQGISQNIKAHGLDGLFDATLTALKTAPAGSLIFTNFVDFDSHYGHRRDVVGYAAGLEYLDRRLPELDALLKPDDIVVLAADHGCDPTWRGTDHTREHIPVLLWGPKIKAANIGKRKTFADIGQSIATYLGVKPLSSGHSFL
jgi:phosphopentomutase